ncbi:MAG: HNH endonuclease, partial [Petrotogales bacterium]
EFEIKGVRSKTKYATEIGIVKSQLKKQFGNFEETFGYQTKFKREQILQLPKSHHFDAVAICCEEGELADLSNIVYFKKHVSKGDYQQTKGSHSEKRIPTGKLFGLRKFDYIKTPKGVGFVKGKRSDGRFAICDIFWKTINGQVQIKKNCTRLTARTTTLIERRKVHSPTGQAAVVPCT